MTEAARREMAVSRGGWGTTAHVGAASRDNQTGRTPHYRGGQCSTPMQQTILSSSFELLLSGKIFGGNYGGKCPRRAAGEFLLFTYFLASSCTSVCCCAQSPIHNKLDGPVSQHLLFRDAATRPPLYCFSSPSLSTSEVLVIVATTTRRAAP